MSVDLRVDWCSYKAAKYAVEHWHYSRTMPASVSKPSKFGVWEDDKFVGAIIYTTGVSSSLGKPYGLKNTEVCELQRVALSEHKSSVTRCIALSLRLLKKQNPGLRLVVSFADMYQDHYGIIYQAGNWIYSGQTGKTIAYFDKATGRSRHPRNIRKVAGRDGSGITMHAISEVNSEERPPKHRYLYPLDRAMRKQIEPLRKPYPKRETCGPSVEGDTPSQTESVVRSAGAAPETVLTA